MLSTGEMGALATPRTVAVVGASRDETKLSGKTVAYLRRFGFSGRIIPVSRSAGVVAGIPTVPALTASDGVELAILAVPADHVADQLEMCRTAGVTATVVFAGGFGELGERGAANEAALRGIPGIGVGGMRVVGPNCLGFVHPETGVMATFGSVLDDFEPAPGNAALVTRSGGFGSGVLGAANAAGLGCSWWVSTGNEFDVTLAEMLESLVEQDDVERLLVCSEGLTAGDAFVRAARRAQQLSKPIVMLDTGRSTHGARAAASHTGTAAGQHRVFESIADELGVIRVRSLQSLLDAGRALAAHPHGARAGATIVTVSGGSGVLAADASADAGLALASWDAPWRERLARGLPPLASTANPVDVTATSDSRAFEHAVRTAASHPDTGVIVALLANRRRDEAERVKILTEAQAASDTPIVVSWVGASAGLESQLAAAHVPAFPDPTRAVDAAAVLVTAGALAALGERDDAEAHSHAIDRRRELAAAQALADRSRWVPRADGSLLLTDEASRELLAAYGVTTPHERTVDNAAEALRAAELLGYPVVLKARSTELLHRSAAGLVRTGISNGDELRSAIDALRGLSSGRLGRGGLVVQQQVGAGCELLAGITRDPAFGTVMLIASGGVLTELIDDGMALLPPASPSHAERVAAELRAVRHPLDSSTSAAAIASSAAETLAAISRLAADCRDIVAEADFNPLIVSPDGTGRLIATAVDWVVLGDPAATG
ncbi:acetate--CoA ligase family protein [Gryllotalpicola protaetiae]|uniref:ATP-grasp domain-containing protein n=1 Tax=Gryllotalpicola protaetiae TaxID=2419771 RepID=A0A387BM85_9MICO|nr:acetate--CoA ligase family protein [Gryllotalpicola protaetiae]AYG03144.1 hypothetical protein D7I44_06120 [Gryllotalpicola protaetiae]